VSGYTLPELVARFGGELRNDSGVRLLRVASLDAADATAIGFVGQAKYLARLGDCRLGAVILPIEAEGTTALPGILTRNPYLYFARVSALFNPPCQPAVGVHPGAHVAEGVWLGQGVSIAAGAVLEAGVRVGDGSIVGPNCVLGANVKLGSGCRLHANVTIYEDCELADRVELHSGCVIGADGFGLAADAGRWVKIPQLGRVCIGNDVEIGAATTVDRGAMGDTVIEEGVKLDNLIQVAHNVRIGAHTAIAACTGIAGSAKIGRHCTIGGAAMLFGHIEIADGTRISTNTLITKSLTQPGTYTSALPFSEHAVWQKNAVHLRNLDKLVSRIKALEARLAELEKSS
jgi:UDP-3-O-[3-hydroxymyristoyl] glucosamine N-acyltransferase